MEAKAVDRLTGAMCKSQRANGSLRIFDAPPE
jgi:hypothetical protein